MREVDTRPLEFVESDGEPMGETELHVEQILDLLAALKNLAKQRGDQSAHAGANLNFYYDRTNPAKRVTPDVFFVRGLADPTRPRRSFKLWEEGRAPELILEIASRATWEEDLGRKKELYRDVFGTSEYLVFDPEEGILEAGPLLAWRLSGRAYRRVGGASEVESKVLGATFRVIRGRLRIVDERGEIVPGLEGLRDGVEAALRKAAARVLESRFGLLAPTSRSRLLELDAEELEALLARAATARSIDQALQ